MPIVGDLVNTEKRPPASGPLSAFRGFSRQRGPPPPGHFSVVWGRLHRHNLNLACSS